MQEDDVSRARLACRLGRAHHADGVDVDALEKRLRIGLGTRHRVLALAAPQIEHNARKRLVIGAHSPFGRPAEPRPPASGRLELERCLRAFHPLLK